jgi:hypothetical protein
MATQNVDPIALSSVYLKALGPQYDTPYNRRVLAAWMKVESGSGPNGTVAVHGYNALNWTTPALTPAARTLSTGSWSNPGHEFPTYDTPEAAGAAFADIMNNNFTNIGAALKGNGNQDPAVVIANSAWVHGWNSSKPSYSINTLNSIINGLSGNITTPLTGTGSGSGKTSPLSNSTGETPQANAIPFAGTIASLFPNTLPTATLVDSPGNTDPSKLDITLVATKIASLTGEKEGDVYAWLFDKLGKPANSVSVTLNTPGKTFQGTDSAGSPLDPITSIASTLAQVATHIVPLSAIALGVVFMLFGGYIIYRSSDQPSYDPSLIGQIK